MRCRHKIEDLHKNIYHLELQKTDTLYPNLCEMIYIDILIKLTMCT